MYPSKKQQQNSPDPKDLSGFETRRGLTVEYDSCYRGKIEIWKDQNGVVVRVNIIR